MRSPRSGFRRVTVTSWALAGIGVAGVAGASHLAYTGTLKSVAEDMPVAAPVAIRAVPPAVTPVSPSTPARQAPAAAPVAPAPPGPTRQAPAPPPPAYAPPQEPTYTPPPVDNQAAIAPQAPVYTAPVQQAPAAVPRPPQSDSPIRRSTVRAGGGSVSPGNKFTPSHTASRGS